MTADCFRASYETKLVDPSLWSVYSSRTWSSIIDSLDLPETLLLSTVKDQLLAFFYVMQPPGVVNQPYIQVGVHGSYNLGLVGTDSVCPRLLSG